MSRTLDFEPVLKPRVLTPEDQVTEVVKAVYNLSHKPMDADNLDTLQDATRQLVELWDKYLDGELKIIWGDTIPF